MPVLFEVWSTLWLYSDIIREPLGYKSGHVDTDGLTDWNLLLDSQPGFQTRLLAVM